MRRFIAVTAIVLGAGMMLVPPVLHLFSRTSAAEKLTVDIRPAMTDQALAHTRAEFDTGRAALGQFVDQGIPRMAADLGQTPAQFRSSIDARYPDVANGIRQLPAITTFVDGAINLFDTNRGKFHSADAIPTTWLPFTVGPWMFILLGLLLVALGAAVALGAGGRAPVAALLVVGLVLAVSPFVVRFPQKTSDGRELVALLRAPLSQQSADQLQAWQTTVEKMTAQLQSGVLPAVAGQLHLSPQGMNDYVARNMPALATGLPQFQPIVAHMATLVAKVQRNVAPYAKTRRIPFRALTWLFFIPGALLTVAAGLGLLGTASRAASRTPGRVAAPTPL